jgi:hypothetical protein
MRRPALLLLLAALALVLAACGENDKEALDKACPQAAPAMQGVPKLPGKFPDAPGIVYTGIKTQGPTTVVTGYLSQTIGPAHKTYSTALKNAAGYGVTHEEQDAADSEVNFQGNGKSGQVKMLQICKARTKVTITIRPA